MAHGTAHDAAQHVTAPLIGRQHAVGNQERHRTQMVGDDAIGRHGFRGRRAPDCRSGRIDHMAEHVGFKDALDTLKDRGHPLEPHPRIDRGARQRFLLAVTALLVLHEHQIPELEEPVAVFFRRARRAAPDMIAAIDKDFRARTARARIAHRPEIVRSGNTDDLVIGKPGDLFPEVRRFVIGVINGDQQLVLVETELFGDQRPGHLDGLFLEIVAEGKIAQHLEKGQMPRRKAHIVEIVVLAPCPHAFLRGRGARIGPLFKPGKNILELHHARIGEHQRRIVARHQRA